MLRAAVGAFALLSGATGAVAGRLPSDKCEGLKTEHAALAATGVRDTLAKGPDWARANLNAAKLREVQRFIVVEEQLLFRCGLAHLKDLKIQETDETADTSADKIEAEPPPLPKRSPGKVTKSKAARVTQPASAADVPTPKRPTKSAKKRPVKAKIDDAYRPPPRQPAPAPTIQQ